MPSVQINYTLQDLMTLVREKEGPDVTAVHTSEGGYVPKVDLDDVVIEVHKKG